MNNPCLLISACTGISIFLSTATSAALIDNGGGLIYDTALNITWAQPDGGRTWDEANSWAAGLTLGGVSGWRLPYISVAAGVGPTNNAVDCSTATEEECRDNELAYMFYHNLGGTFDQPILESGDPDLGLFPTLQSYTYWSGTYGDPEWETNYAWNVSFSGRAIVGSEPKSADNLTWAVHAGDVSPIPVPAAAIDGDPVWDDNSGDYTDVLCPQSGTSPPHWSVSDGAGGVIVVCQEEISFENNQYKFWAQRLDHNGNTSWDPEGSDYAVYIGLGGRGAAVTSDRQGGVLVAWSRDNFGDGTYHTEVQRIRADGMLMWPSIGGPGNGAGVSVCTEPCAKDISVIADGYGGATVGFDGTVALVSDTGTVSFYDGLDGNGDLIEVVPSASPYFGGYRLLNDESLYPMVVPPYLAYGFFATWIESHVIRDQTVFYLYGRHIYPDVAGVPQFSTPAALGTMVYDSDYSLASDGAGGMLTTWRAYSTTQGSYLIQVNRMIQYGVSGGALTVLDSSVVGGNASSWSNARRTPAVITRSGPGESILAWVDYRDDASGDIYAQRLNANGEAQWTPNGIPVRNQTGYEGSPSIASDLDSGALVAFEGWAINEFPFGRAIIVSRLEPGGHVLWSQAIKPDDAAEQAPQVVFDNSGPSPQGAIITWRGLTAHKINQSLPANDVCALPTVIGEGSHLGSLTRSTPDGSTSCGGNTADSASVWYQYTAPFNGTLRINTCGTNDIGGTDQGIDTVLSLHGGCPGESGNELACGSGNCCNDDFLSGPDQSACIVDNVYGWPTDTGLARDSALAKVVTAGEVVTIRVSHYASSYAGSFRLNLALESLDSDGDGLPDDVENGLGTDPNDVDTDNDGLVDGADGVVPVGSLPGGIDVNGDGFVDGEQNLGTDPTVSNVGDVAPRGSPDNLINLGDLMVLTRLATGAILPTPLESILGDINSDTQLNAADILLLQQSVMNGTSP